MIGKTGVQLFAVMGVGVAGLVMEKMVVTIMRGREHGQSFLRIHAVTVIVREVKAAVRVIQTVVVYALANALV